MMGELSPFFEAFGIYTDGVSPETAKLPKGWRKRQVKVQNENTNGASGGVSIRPIWLSPSTSQAGIRTSSSLQRWSATDLSTDRLSSNGSKRWP